MLKSYESSGQLFKGTQEIQRFHEPTKSKGGCPASPGGLFPEKFSLISVCVLAVSLCNGV